MRDRRGCICRDGSTAVGLGFVPAVRMPMYHRQRHPRLRERGVELKAFFGRGTRARLDSLWCDIGKIRKELERLGERGVSSGKRGILMDCLREIFRGTRNT